MESGGGLLNRVGGVHELLRDGDGNGLRESRRRPTYIFLQPSPPPQTKYPAHLSELERYTNSRRHVVPSLAAILSAICLF